MNEESGIKPAGIGSILGDISRYRSNKAVRFPVIPNSYTGA
jgi:hypothetical protein